MGSNDGTERFAATSSVQDGLWWLAKLSPGSPVHTVCRAYRVAGRLDVDGLRAAWRALVRRHESLRCTIVERAGRPVLRIAGDVADDVWSFVDLASQPADQPDAAAGAFCAGLTATPLRPAVGPPARLAVARLGAEEHVVALVVHRAVADDASISIVVDELSAGYASVVDGAGPADPLPTPPRQYADHARRQRAQEHRHLLDWWRATLTPLPAVPDLPVDHVRPPALSAPAGVEPFDWGARLGRPLAELSAVERAEPQTVLLAAFQILLHRYGGGDRVAVGMPASVRPVPEFAGTVGPFDTLLVPCTDFTGRLTFRELVRRVDAAVTDALAHRALPFDELVRALDVDRVPFRIPWCDTMFVVKAPEPRLRLAGAQVTRQPTGAGAALADLTLTVDADGSAATGTLEYRADAFEAASARLILEQLRTLLTAALTDPDLPVHALPLESRERLSAAIRDADRVADGPAGPEPVNALVHRVAERAPDAPALSFGGTRVSYAELRAHAAQITAALTEVAGGGHSAVSGKPVVVRMPTGPRQIAAVLGVLDTGAHLVCLGADEMGERGRTMLADVRPACLVIDGSSGPDALAQWYADELDGRVVDVAAPPAPATAPTLVRGTPEGRAYVAHTSGSTGRPKGIPHSHATLAQFVTWFAGEFRIGPGARVAQWAAPGYDASLCEAFAALVAGATLCPVPDRIRANPEKIVDWLATERITHFQTVPSFAREILRVVGDRAGAPEHLDHLLLAGEALPGELADGLRAALPSVRLINLYGPTELILATWHEVADEVRGVMPVGRSIPGRQVLVLDDQDRPCPAGVTGDIVIRSPHTTPGYLGPAAGDRAPFRPIADTGGWGIGGACYRTGDLGRRRFDGTLEFRGRKDLQVKFNGIRLELGDIEAALTAHDSVAECAVVAVTDANRMVTRLVAYVVPVRGPDGTAAGTATDWRAALRARFGKAMPPITFRTLIGLPRNIGGKIDRRRLPDPGPGQVGAGPEPESWAERAMAATWSELGVHPQRADDTFFAAGGHSLLVPRLLHAVRRRFGVSIAIPEFFADSTLAGLAARVESYTTTTGIFPDHRHIGH
ncbi:non-ribosomal peptide synthetase [Streptosporangium sp. NBC_01756]|uniref:non-ribosomal peptide synthetase n=1 Tax=Streptosporangium sp. NBC_01756 TaxID=2975950 RepID=UPI002DDB70B7|nr:AMP-binding protein [Streptosporangium sp. NBC_01756]WSC85383.1 AMP-binding protein [Streptosporangium sp. NBC_01756]